jgi:hypothetical protein
MVIVIGTVDGAIIIGEVQDDNEKYYKLNNPVRLFVDVQSGKMGMVAVCPLKIKGEYCIYKTGIIYETVADENVSKMYDEYLLAIGEKKIFTPSNYMQVIDLQKFRKDRV